MRKLALLITVKPVDNNRSLRFQGSINGSIEPNSTVSFTYTYLRGA